LSTTTPPPRFKVVPSMASTSLPDCAIDGKS
jgi:hypothetical protein